MTPSIGPNAPVVRDAQPADSYDATAKQKAGAKLSRIPVKVQNTGPALKKPEWIRVKAGSPSTRFYEIKDILRENNLVTVCEEASCPNIHECFGHGTATFMILGEVCTRRCSFRDVAHGRPKPPDPSEPLSLANTVADMGLKYVVVTSVDRDDLRDGGAQHFVDCIAAIRESATGTRIEILTPDFRGKGRMDRALEILAETRRRLYGVLADGPAPRPPRGDADHLGVHLQRDGDLRRPAGDRRRSLFVNGLSGVFQQVGQRLLETRRVDPAMQCLRRRLQLQADFEHGQLVGHRRSGRMRQHLGRHTARG